MNNHLVHEIFLQRTAAGSLEEMMQEEPLDYGKMQPWDEQSFGPWLLEHWHMKVKQDDSTLNNHRQKTPGRVRSWIASQLASFRIMQCHYRHLCHSGWTLFHLMYKNSTLCTKWFAHQANAAGAEHLSPVFKISAEPLTLTGKIWVGPASFPSLSHTNFGKIVLRSSKFQILFWRLYHTSSKCHWSIYRTSRKRGIPGVVHKVKRSSPTVCVCQSRACPCNNSWLVQVTGRITKFGSKVQNTMLKVPFFLESDWPWAFYPILRFKITPAITHHPFNLGSADLDQRCKATLLRSLMF